MGKEVLVVDDDPDFVETMEIILNSNGYETRTAENGKEALKEIEKKKPDIMLLDIIMKTKSDGIWVSEKIKEDENFKDMPVVMITAINQDADMVKFNLEPDKDKDYLPVEGFLEKPIEPEELLKKIKELIG